MLQYRNINMWWSIWSHNGLCQKAWTWMYESVTARVYTKCLIVKFKIRNRWLNNNNNYQNQWFIKKINCFLRCNAIFRLLHHHVLIVVGRDIVHSQFSNNSLRLRIMGHKLFPGERFEMFALQILDYWKHVQSFNETRTYEGHHKKGVSSILRSKVCD